MQLFKVRVRLNCPYHCFKNRAASSRFRRTNSLKNSRVCPSRGGFEYIYVSKINSHREESSFALFHHHIHPHKGASDQRKNMTMCFQRLEKNSTNPDTYNNYPDLTSLWKR